ncbi:CUAEP/CCAEP-tail radical SAM protein [Mesorhizobium sp. M1380]|uniref:CUAEP/CCAEP-tail radical SAM (seleno)protein n=1 Tax=Mesorhizobium sp. M1380 TaxID=2957093 RepID=UPI00333C06B3
MNVLLISTYDLGHQPFGLASLAAWLQHDGAQIACNDLAVEKLNEEAVKNARMICLHIPMHTATRLAIPLIETCRRLNPGAHICCYGLYAPLNEAYLRKMGANSIVGGEFESEIAQIYAGISSADISTFSKKPTSLPSITKLSKLQFRKPNREGLPQLTSYSKLIMPNGEERTVGYTEASRGCKHMCRHCPVVPVYNGNFRIVQRDVVMDDIRQLVRGGASHISFGDPDFFNGVGHAIPLVQSLHREFPDISYDVVVKIEHLLKFHDMLTILKDTGCLIITSAVESVDDRVLAYLSKGHTRDEFLRVVELVRAAGIHLGPTFVPFTPWTSIYGYLELLSVIEQMELVESVAPVQLAIRLLLPQGSHLFQLKEMARWVGDFDEASLAYPWVHPDPRVDALHSRIKRIVQNGEARGKTRCEIFYEVFDAAEETAFISANASRRPPDKTAPKSSPPRMTEAWYCCAEPTEDQFSRL